MPTPAEKLASSLEILRELQEQGRSAIRSADLSRTHRERLVKSGFLQEVMKGWYIPSQPGPPAGESTAWYASFWNFCAVYLQHRFGDAWCLSPEHSLTLHAGNRTIPRQLLVRSPSARNQITELPHGTSLLDVRAAMPDPAEIVVQEGLRLFSVPAALIACAPSFYTAYPADARAALSMVRSASDLLPRLLEGGHSTIAGRLAGAMRNIGRERIAGDIVQTMRAAGYQVQESDPFSARLPVILSPRETSPYVNRLRLMWQQMRGAVIDLFPPASERLSVDAYLRQVADIYVTDAYHSLSIEGYRVSSELIERVRDGKWNPDANDLDREHRNALAARGYWQAYQAVRLSLRRVLKSENPGAVADEDHGTWYREMFAPGVTAGLLRPADLAGYRNGQVFIQRSMHVPPNHEAVRDLMPAFFDLLREEEAPSVRVVLGHFAFVSIHPYMDGNGRMGRFMMNLMCAAGGYPWTVVPVQERRAYMEALEEASVRQNIVPFTEFLAGLLTRVP
ncbi:MAG TPA: Fic family protein [Desulfuromonadales bacterium]|nr:Fic family protein [Desulfuromonadales bacterium]